MPLLTAGVFYCIIFRAKYHPRALEENMSIYDLTVKDAEGSDVPLERYKGKVLLIAVTATRSRFTPQYIGLQALYEKYHDQGLEILDFPCDQFGASAPGTAEEIAGFCSVNYGVSYSQFAKVIAEGDDEDPLFTYLKNEKKGFFTGHIGKPFVKFLVDRDGNVAERYAPSVEPEMIESRIKDLLKLKAE